MDVFWQFNLQLVFLEDGGLAVDDSIVFYYDDFYLIVIVVHFY
jgi:hypothetical protein